MPPITPEPSHISQIWCWYTPSAEITRPPHQHSADTTPALRGPACSSQPPNSHADRPRKTKNIVYIQPSIEICQSQVDDRMRSISPISTGQASDSLMPIARDSGSQNTEKP